MNAGTSSKYLFDTTTSTSLTVNNFDKTGFLVREPNLANSMGLSFFGTSNSYPSLVGTWSKIEDQVAANASTIGSAATSTASETASAALGVGGTIAEETGVVAADAVAEGVAGPVGLALMANQQLGQAVASGMTSAEKTQSSKDLNQNLLQHGLNVDLNAQLIQSNQQATIQNQESGAFIGSMFGPIGALIGHAVAGVVSANPTSFLTANSFVGDVNPTDTGIVAAQSTAAATGQSTMQDNVTS